MNGTFNPFFNFLRKFKREQNIGVLTNLFCSLFLKEMLKFVKKESGLNSKNIPDRLIYKREYKNRYSESDISKLPEFAQNILRKENEEYINWLKENDILLIPRPLEED